MTGLRALSLLASFLVLWAGTAMLLSACPGSRDSVSLAERLALYGWGELDREVECWLGTVGDAGST